MAVLTYQEYHSKVRNGAQEDQTAVLPTAKTSSVHDIEIPVRYYYFVHPDIGHVPDNTVYKVQVGEVVKEIQMIEGKLITNVESIRDELIKAGLILYKEKVHVEKGKSTKVV